MPTTATVDASCRRGRSSRERGITAALLVFAATLAVAGVPPQRRAVRPGAPHGVAQTAPASNAAVPDVPATPELALAQGDAAFGAGRADDAILNYLRAADLDPVSDVPLLRLAAVQESRRQNDAALATYALALQRVPGRAATHESMGFLLLREGRFVSAEAAFREASAQTPPRWRSLMGLALALQRQGRAGEARKSLDMALALEPASAELLLYSAENRLEAGDVEQALREAQLSLAQGAPPAGWLLVGDCLARQQDFTGGFEAYLRALSEPDAYLRIGEEAMLQREFERAARYFQEAQRASPSHNEEAAKRLAVARERLLDARSGKPAGG